MKTAVLAVLALLAGSLLAAEERARGGEPELPVAVPAPPHPVDTRPRTLAVAPGRAALRAPVPDPKLGLVRAIARRDGEATLMLQAGRRTVHPGDVILGDTVKLVEPGRVVLLRPDPQGGDDSIVIVHFDAENRGRVTIYAARDTSPPAPPPPPTAPAP
jgi:hypothetical protein